MIRRVSVPSPRVAGGGAVESEKLRHWESQSIGNPVQSFEGWSIPAAFHEAEKIHRYVEHFGEPLLSHSAAESNFPQAPSKPLSQGGHLECASKRECVVVSLRVPPNEITGSPPRHSQEALRETQNA